MTAETKFKIGDIVYTISSGEEGIEVILFKIVSLDINIDEDINHKITYYNENFYARYENELYTKEQALEMINNWLK